MLISTQMKPHNLHSMNVIWLFLHTVSFTKKKRRRSLFAYSSISMSIY